MHIYDIIYTGFRYRLKADLNFVVQAASINGRKDVIMEKDRKIVFNTHLLFIVFIFFIFLGMGILFLSGNEDGNIPGAIGSFAIALAPVFVFIISPAFYIFDSEKLTIVYFLGFKEKIAWREILSISAFGGWFVGGGRGMPIYEIAYPLRNKHPFFANSCIARNRKTTKLIKKHFKGNIQK